MTPAERQAFATYREQVSHDVLTVYRRLVTWAVRCTGVYAILTGVLVIVGGDSRLSAPIYVTIRNLWAGHGAPVSVLLGIPLVLFGVLVLWPLLRVSQAGLALIVAWHLYLAGSFIWAAFVQPLAGFPGLMAELYTAVAACALLAVRGADRLGWRP